MRAYDCSVDGVRRGTDRMPADCVRPSGNYFMLKGAIEAPSRYWGREHTDYTVRMVSHDSLMKEYGHTDSY